MTRDEVLQALGAWIRAEYGKLLVLREVRRVRRAAGTTWRARVVGPAPEGDITVGDLEIDEDGSILNEIGVAQLLDAVRRPQESEPEAAGADPFGGELSELRDMGEEEPAAATTDLDGLSDEALYARASALAGSNDPEALEQARHLMPRLLGDAEKRAAVLVWMAVIERKLGQIPIALQHLEAAAREFADRFDLGALEKLAALAKELMGDDAYPASPIKKMLDEGREKLRPVQSIFECPQFQFLPPIEREWLDSSLELRTLQPGEDLVREGEPSRNVFVIKSGLIGVHLEKPEGGTQLVRSCFPGWLLGESSVLVPDDPRCTATLRAERPSEVWVIDAAILKDAMKENPDLRYRIEATKQLHRIDSFFSMHETMSQLEALVRDEMLACIRRIQTFDADGVLVPANEPPKVAGLVLRGEIAVFEGEGKEGAPLALIPADRFLGVRDAMHAIAPATTAVARAGSVVALFDADMLRALGEKSPEHVVAVLERLG